MKLVRTISVSWLAEASQVHLSCLWETLRVSLLPFRGLPTNGMLVEVVEKTTNCSGVHSQ